MNAKDFFVSRGVTRLCHFTKFESFIEIISPNSTGILPTNTIRDDIREPVDLDRLDGRADCSCSCSIEYPNCWYFRKAIQRNYRQLFHDWVIIFIDLDILSHRNAEYCPRNAAACYGQFIFQGADHLHSLYANVVFNRRRTPNMLSCCPTDDQAEVLIHGNIPIDYFKGYAVNSQEMANRLFSALRIYDREELPIFLAPDIFSTQWSNLVRKGIRPDERRIQFSS